MRVKVNLIEQFQEELAEFFLYEETEALAKVIAILENAGAYLIGYKNERTYKVNYDEILYIETVDKKCFIYTVTDVFSSREKLYQLEGKLSQLDFLRVSKSIIVNLDKLLVISPTFSGRFEGTLSNKEKITISRSYVAKLKKKIGMGRTA